MFPYKTFQLRKSHWTFHWALKSTFPGKTFTPMQKTFLTDILSSFVSIHFDRFHCIPLTSYNRLVMSLLQTEWEKTPKQQKSHALVFLSLQERSKAYCILNLSISLLYHVSLSCNSQGSNLLPLSLFPSTCSRRSATMTIKVNYMQW